MSKLNYEHVFNTLVEETAKYITKNNLKAKDIVLKAKEFTKEYLKHE